MKRTLLLFFTLVVATMGSDIIRQVADGLDLTREEVQTCFNETDVTSEDVMHYERYIVNGPRATHYDGSALKIGCFFACSMKKKGVVMTDARINANKMKEIIFSWKNTKPDEYARIHQAIETCANHVKNETNECEVSLKFVLCVQDGVKTAPKNNNDNE